LINDSLSSLGIVVFCDAAAAGGSGALGFVFIPQQQVVQVEP